MEKDAQGKSHWFPLAADQFIQGLVATDGCDSLLYIVTEEHPQSCHPRHRWPRILISPKAIPRPNAGYSLF